MKKERTPAFCNCGCGSLVEQAAGSGRPRKWIPGHAKPVVEKLCACGCGTSTRTGKRGPAPKFIAGHPLVVEPAVEPGNAGTAG